MVAEVSQHATETVLSLRRGVAVLARSMFGEPKDYQTSRVHNSAARWVFQTRNPKDDRKRNIYRAVFLPIVLIDKGCRFSFGWCGSSSLYSMPRVSRKFAPTSKPEK